MLYKIKHTESVLINNDPLLTVQTGRFIDFSQFEKHLNERAQINLKEVYIYSITNCTEDRIVRAHFPEGETKKPYTMLFIRYRIIRYRTAIIIKLNNKNG